MKKKKLEQKITKTRKKLAHIQEKLNKLVAAEAKKAGAKPKAGSTTEEGLDAGAKTVVRPRPKS